MPRFLGYLRGGVSVCDPDHMTAEERYDYLTDILAEGLLKLIYDDWKRQKNGAGATTSSSLKMPTPIVDPNSSAPSNL